MMKIFFILFLVFIYVFSYGQDNVGIGLWAGLYSPSLKVLNDEITNSGPLDYFWYPVDNSVKFKPVESALLYSPEVQAKISRNAYIVLNTANWAGQTSVKWSGTFLGSPYDTEVVYKILLSPALMKIRYNLGGSEGYYKPRNSFFVFLGVNYCTARVEGYRTTNWGTGTIITFNDTIKASGTGVAGTLGAGFENSINEMMKLGINFENIFGVVSQIKYTENTPNPDMVDQPVTYVDSGGNTKDLPVELTGINFYISLKMEF